MPARRPTKTAQLQGRELLKRLRPRFPVLFPKALEDKSGGFAPGSPPITGESGTFPASGGAFRGPAPPDRASPATARVSALGKVYI